MEDTAASALLSTCVQLLTSWPAVYGLMVAPAAVLLINFIFGDCFIADAIEGRRAGNIGNGCSPPKAGAGAGAASTTDNSIRRHLRAKRRGRLTIVVVYLLLVWQYHAYMVTFRSRFKDTKVQQNWAHLGYTSPSTATCSPLHFAWNFVLMLSDKFVSPEAADSVSLGDSLAALFTCRGQEMMYLFFLASFIGFHLRLVLSVPQVPPPPPPASQPPRVIPALPPGVALPGATTARRQSKLTEQGEGASPTATAPQPGGALSFCSKCNAHVPEMCHHCFFVNNCISVRRNRWSFLYLVVIGGAQAIFLVTEASPWFVHVVLKAQLVDGILDSGQAPLSGALSFLSAVPIPGLFHQRPESRAIIERFFRGLSALEVFEITLGMTFTGLCFAALLLFFVFQMLLLWNGLTILTFYKRAARDSPLPHADGAPSTTAAQFRCFLHDVWQILIVPLLRPRVRSRRHAPPHR